MIDDEEVSRAIVEKFEKLGGASVSYAEIAKKAWEVGRTRLATMVSYSVLLALDVGCNLRKCSYWITNRGPQIKFPCCS
jgi:hypothetical protein